MIRRLAILVLCGRNSHHKASRAWTLYQRRNDSGLPAWTHEQIARECGYKSPEAAAVAIAIHDRYIFESTNIEAERRKSAYRLVEATDPDEDTIEVKADDR